ncbi:hypothetical protein [Sphingosinicella sp. BN140058]|uniref:hypothetical protein n=1 Tax=Sphingosinicella sp. BN140058 TaxID=1892855 RepID=UPI00101283E5|nr:hypothetical protein [Sphingosinicella sp. BN140058]QAY80238.1 hypothetical protein ETR14_26710 [Sphingosinicella sp. BN140058]
MPMVVMGLSLPDEAVAEARVAIAGDFMLDDVRGTLSAALISRDFDFGPLNKDKVVDRAADRILQKAKRDGLATYQGGRWSA